MRLAFNAALPTRILAGGALAFALAGCAGMNSQGVFGAPGTDVDTAAATGPVSASGTTVAGGTPDGNQVTCPPATVRSGASAWQVPAAGGGLRAQGTLGNIARECNVAGGQMTIKVGIEGRVLLGDKGSPGAFSVPIRVALVSEGPEPKTLQTKFFTVPVQVPAGETQAAFAVVEDGIVLPLPARLDDLDRYIIYVGFDSKGEPAARPARPRPTTPRPAAATAPAAAAPAAVAPARAAAPAASTTSAPQSDTFGPAPTFAPPAASGTVGPATNTFGPPPTR